MRATPLTAPDYVRIIRTLYPMSNPALVQSVAPYLAKWLGPYRISDTNQRLANFLGQTGVESDHYKVMSEYASGAQYNGRADLGNTQPGDGPRYKGHGIIQVTGRFNHRKMGQALGYDAEANPMIFTQPEPAVRSAAEYWRTRGLNTLADMGAEGNIVLITKRIQGGSGALTQRTQYTRAARALLDREYPETKPATVADPSVPVVADPAPGAALPITPAPEEGHKGWLAQLAGYATLALGYVFDNPYIMAIAIGVVIIGVGFLIGRWRKKRAARKAAQAAEQVNGNGNPA